MNDMQGLVVPVVLALAGGRMLGHVMSSEAIKHKNYLFWCCRRGSYKADRVSGCENEHSHCTQGYIDIYVQNRRPL